MTQASDPVTVVLTGIFRSIYCSPPCLSDRSPRGCRGSTPAPCSARCGVRPPGTTSTIAAPPVERVLETSPRAGVRGDLARSSRRGARAARADPCRGRLTGSHRFSWGCCSGRESHYNVTQHMLAALIIGSFLVALFAFELGRMWWRQNAWRRRWRNRDADDN